MPPRHSRKPPSACRKSRHCSRTRPRPSRWPRAGPSPGAESELLKRALALDPNDPKTVAMSGAAAAERKDYDSAIKLYTHLKSMVQPDTEDAQQIDQVIAELEARKGGKPAPSVAAAPAATQAPTAPVATWPPLPRPRRQGAAGSGISDASRSTPSSRRTWRRGTSCSSTRAMPKARACRWRSCRGPRPICPRRSR